MANLTSNTGPSSRQIADLLRQEIEAGAFQPGAQLKSYRRLADDYGVAVNTAQAAVKHLQRMGLVEIRASSGVYVRDPSVTVGHDDLPRLRRELAAVQDQIRESRGALTEAEHALDQIMERLPVDERAD